MFNEEHDAICALHDLDLLMRTLQIVIVTSPHIVVVVICYRYLQLTSIRVCHLYNRESNAITITQQK
jgi:hypothetical protein